MLAKVLSSAVLGMDANIVDAKGAMGACRA